MGLIGWIMLFAHVGLFLFLRKRYVAKKQIAEKRAAEFEIENIQLRSKVKDLESMF